MKKIFADKALPSVVLQEDHSFSLPTTCAVYGAYRGRENEAEENTICLNKQVTSSMKILISSDLRL